MAEVGGGQLQPARRVLTITGMQAMPYVLVRADGAMALRGLRVLVGGPEKSPGVPAHGGAGAVAEVQEKLDGFLAYAGSIHLDIHRQVVALESRGVGDWRGAPVIAGMCLWVPAPGRTAMLFAPGLSDYPEAAEASRVSIEAALDDARAAGVLLVQAMMEPADAAGKTVFAAAGLTQLATLTYMERRAPTHPPAFSLPAGLTLLPYGAQTHEHFRQAIAESYQDTLDCPAMSGMRAVDDVMEGHKSVGIFEPQLWSVLMEGGQAVGCLLLAEIAARRALELVYLGLSPAARGRGLGRLLMQRVLRIAANRSFELATLAVDAANIPAARLYRRCGYTSVAQRVAMIKRL